MIKDNKDINQLLQKYKAGTLTPEERFELEKMALDDDFLFDALEGISRFDTQKTSTPHNYNYSRRIWIVAAAFVAIVSMVWLIKNNLPDKGHNITDDRGTPMLTMRNDKKEHSTEEMDATKPETSTARYSSTLPKNAPLKSPTVNHKTAKKTLQKKATVNEVAPKNKKVIPPQRFLQKKESQSITYKKPKTMVNSSQSRPGKIHADENINTDKPSEMADVTMADSHEELPADKINTLEKVTAAISSDSDQIAVPIVGKKTFDDFVRQKMKAKGYNLPKGTTIKIGFTIDSEGRPNAFKNLTPQYQKEGAYLISLLQNSGEWSKVDHHLEAYYEFVF